VPIVTHGPKTATTKPTVATSKAKARQLAGLCFVQLSVLSVLNLFRLPNLAQIRRPHIQANE
jgi:hypothetical protein